MRTEDALQAGVVLQVDLEIMVEGSAATAYVNGETALSFRMYDYSGRNLGLFSFVCTHRVDE